MLFALDRKWFLAREPGAAETYLEEAKRTFDGAIVTSATAVPGVLKVQFNRRVLNSGGAAIVLAHLWGASRVVLLGFDAMKDGTKVHHHGDHPPGLGNAGSMPNWPGQFELVKASVGLMPVINCSRKTALRMFPLAPLAEEIRPPSPRPARPPRIVLTGMLGLGDNIYQRAVVRELGPLELVTPWPQLYADLADVRCIRSQTRLRTQAKNTARGDAGFVQPTVRLAGARIGYSPQDPTTMLDSMMKSAKLKRDRLTFDLPSFPQARPARPPYVVIRPATVRAEWRADARNPLTQYLTQAAQRAADAGFRVISVADVDGVHEWLVDEAPPAHERFHAGELGLEALLALVEGAAGVIGGVGWLVPAAMAYRVPMLCIFGGWGVANGPRRIFDPRLDNSMIVQALPDRFCMCNDRAHSCDRSISKFGAYLESFVDLAGKRRAAVDPREGRRLLPGSGTGIRLGLLDPLPGARPLAERRPIDPAKARGRVTSHPDRRRGPAEVR